jgi:uncharacterized membrane protein YbhN (UPF0104 family)
MTAMAARRQVLGAVALAVGVLALYCVVKQAGFSQTVSLLKQALPFLPVALLLEGGRIGTEVMAARNLFALQRSRVPVGSVVRAQLVGYALGNVLPVGRVAAEATKAGILASHAGLANTAAVAAVTQALHLMASAVVLVPCVIAARSSSASLGLTAAIVGQCALLGAIGGAILLAAYFVPCNGRYLNRFPKIAHGLGAFRTAMRSLPHFPIGALAWLVAGRFLQVALLATLARAVGAPFSLTAPFVAQAVLLIGASVADVVPGQIGAFETAFALFSDAIGMSKANAVAVALLVHLVQAAWTVAGFGSTAIGRTKVGQRLSPRTTEAAA